MSKPLVTNSNRHIRLSHNMSRTHPLLAEICTLNHFSPRQVQSLSMSRITNLSGTMISFTSNTICRLAFGKDYGKEGYQSVVNS